MHVTRVPSTPPATHISLFVAPTNRYSTDSWNSSNAGDELQFEWLPEQIILLARTLDALPPALVTPFNGPIPPSNLLDKIARGVSQAKGPLEWPHSLRATRVKIIELSRARAKEENDVNMDEPRRRIRRPCKQSSMDFINTAEDDNVTNIPERPSATSNFHPYRPSRCPSSRTGPSTPSSSTLNTLSSFSSANRILRRTSSNVSSTSASSIAASIPCTDPRVQRVRRAESFFTPAKDIRLAPSTHKENLDSSPLAGVKRAPSFGALAQEARRDRHVFGGAFGNTTEEKDSEQGTYPSSDEEEKLRSKGAKKMRVKDSGLDLSLSPLPLPLSLNTGTNTPPATPSPTKRWTKIQVPTQAPATAPPALTSQLPKSPKSPTVTKSKPKKANTTQNPDKTGYAALAAGNGKDGKEGNTTKTKTKAKRPPPMNLKRNPSIFGAELPSFPSLAPASSPGPIGSPISPYGAPITIPRSVGPELQLTADMGTGTPPQRLKTLRRVQRVALGVGRRISFGMGDGAEADAEDNASEVGEKERDGKRRRERRKTGEMGVGVGLGLGSAFQMH